MYTLMWAIIPLLGLLVLGLKEVIILHRFGSTGLVTGYIKQLLSSFNLLKLPIYTEKHAAYLDEHGVESPYLLESFPDKELLYPSGLEIRTDDNANTVSLDNQLQVNSNSMIPYLKDGHSQFYLGGYYNKYREYIPGKWQSSPFDIDLPQGGSWKMISRNTEVLNLTKKFQIKNNVYDTYTHEYLGDYLRFLRDYDGLNLMSLYNCFSNNSTVNFSISNYSISSTQKLNVDTTDSNYKIYAVPVKLFNNYTIAIDSAYPVEMFCGFYSTGFYTDEKQDFIGATYKRYGSMQFSNPVLYTNLTDIAVSHAPAALSDEDLQEHRINRQLLAEISPHLPELKLFIKVSSLVDSSIVILEGDYRGWNDQTFTKLASNAKGYAPILWNKNKTVLDNAAIFSGIDLKLIAPLQLLKLNTGIHMPFADRLVEYLLDNCITGGEDEPRENVLMAQVLAGQRHKGLVAGLTYYADADKTTTYKVVPEPLKYDFLNGVWTDSLQKIFYNNQQNQASYHEFTDCLGYVDKDVEKNFVAITQSKNKLIKKTMLNFNTWEDIKE